MSRYLALDVGERRIGVAVSDASGTLARPLTTLIRASKAADYSRIAGLVRQHGAEALVVGHPLNDDDTAGPQALRVERYAAALAEALRAEDLALPILLWDEHGSTGRASEALGIAGRKGRDQRERLDAAAAAVILQDYLDVARHPGAVPSRADHPGAGRE